VLAVRIPSASSTYPSLVHDFRAQVAVIALAVTLHDSATPASGGSVPMHTKRERDELWAMILAGGDGTRLRRLTSLVAGDDRPKQFTKFLADETLLDWTRRRVALLVPRERTLLVLTRSHRRYWQAIEAETDARCLVVQPDNRGTAPAILYAALRVAVAAPAGTVTIFPSDHWVSSDERFMAHVRLAVAAVAAHPELVVLLGIDALVPETEYGWIEPGDGVPGAPLRRVERFWEKPGSALAEKLLARGCLWNSFVMVARVPAVLRLVRVSMPALWEAFAGLRATLGSDREPVAVEDLYRALAPESFSDAVLSACPRHLAVLPVTGVGWSDWGQPARVLGTLAGLGITPHWAKVAGGM
jgi:mannose-1-phosphate guanylyltransferase